MVRLVFESIDPRVTLKLCPNEIKIDGLSDTDEETKEFWSNYAVSHDDLLQSTAHYDLLPAHGRRFFPVKVYNDNLLVCHSIDELNAHVAYVCFYFTRLPPVATKDEEAVFQLRVTVETD